MPSSIVDFVQGSMGRDRRQGSAYCTNPIFNLGIEAVWQGFRRLPLEWWTGDPADEASEMVEAAPLAALFDYPRADMTGEEFWEQNVVEYKTRGLVYWFLADKENKPLQGGQKGVLRQIPAQIIPKAHDCIELETDAGRVVGIKYRIGSGYSEVYPLESVVCVGNYRPSRNGGAIGIGAEEVLADELAIWESAAVGMDADMASSDGGAFIIHERQLTPDQADMAQVQADQMASDEARYKVLSGGPQVIANPIKPGDKKYSDIRSDVRDVILAKLGVPPIVVGFLENASYNNIREAKRQMWVGPLGILSMAAVFEGAIYDLQRRLVNGGAIRATQELVPVFSAAGVEDAQEDHADKVAMAAEIVAKGTGVSLGEALQLVGADTEKVDSSGRRFIAAGLTEIVAVDPDADDPEPIYESLTAQQATVLDTIVAAVKSGSKSPEEALAQIAVSFNVDPLKAQELVESIEIAPEPEPAPETDEQDQETAEPVSDSLNSEVKKSYQQRAKSDFVKPDTVLEGRAVSWLRQYEKAQIKRLREVANGSRSIEGLQTRDDKLPTDEEWRLLLLATEVWEKKLQDMALPSIRRLFRKAIRDTAQEIAVGPISSTDPRIVAAFKAQATQLAEGVTSVTTSRVREVILKAFAGIDNDKPLQVAVAEVLPELEGNLKTMFAHKERRAATIARTETGKAQNTARFVQYEAAGVTHLEWRISPSGDHRESHLELDGVEIPLGERFANGLRYPHEEGAPASEAINCRCRCIGHFRDSQEGDDQ